VCSRRTPQVGSSSIRASRRPTPKMDDVLATIARRVRRLLVQRGVWDDDAAGLGRSGPCAGRADRDLGAGPAGSRSASWGGRAARRRLSRLFPPASWPSLYAPDTVDARDGKLEQGALQIARLLEQRVQSSDVVRKLPRDQQWCRWPD
jgi:hypothetical protein